MDTDSIPPLLILALILVGLVAFFAYLSLAERYGTHRSGLLLDAAPSHRAWFILSPFKLAAIMCISSAGFYLLQAELKWGWAPLAVAFLLLLALLILIQLLAGFIAQRRPVWVDRCARPPLALLRSDDFKGKSGGANPLGDNSDEADDDRSPDTLNITTEELVGMDRHDREMLRSIIQLDVTTVREVMIPRLDMIALERNTPLTEAIKPIIESGHTRIPIYEEDLDHIVGIIHSLDLLKSLSSDQPSFDLTGQPFPEDMLRPPYFIPESKRLDHLLEEFQEKAIQMAIVVDEYGGTEGLITMEDLLEEIVGEIEDEFSKDGEGEIVKEEDGSSKVSPGVTIDEIEEEFGVRLHNPDVDTVGGYVYMDLGRMPREGDIVETERLRIKVTSVRGRRIQRLNIQPKSRPNSN